MSFQDCYLPELVYATYLKKTGRGKGLGTATCLKTVVVGKEGHAPCNILWLQHIFFMLVEFNGDHKTVRKLM